MNKRSFRFMTTHLEPVDADVRARQAAELVASGARPPPRRTRSFSWET